MSNSASCFFVASRSWSTRFCHEPILRSYRPSLWSLPLDPLVVLVGPGSGVDQKSSQKRNTITPATTAQGNHGFDLSSSKRDTVDYSLIRARRWHGDDVKPSSEFLLDGFAGFFRTR